jgi:hypothetical protein
MDKYLARKARLLLEIEDKEDLSSVNIDLKKLKRCIDSRHSALRRLASIIICILCQNKDYLEEFKSKSFLELYEGRGFLSFDKGASYHVIFNFIDPVEPRYPKEPIFYTMKIGNGITSNQRIIAFDKEDLNEILREKRYVLFPDFRDSLIWMKVGGRKIGRSMVKRRSRMGMKMGNRKVVNVKKRKRELAHYYNNSDLYSPSIYEKADMLSKSRNAGTEDYSESEDKDKINSKNGDKSNVRSQKKKVSFKEERSKSKSRERLRLEWQNQHPKLLEAKVMTEKKEPGKGQPNDPKERLEKEGEKKKSVSIEKSNRASQNKKKKIKIHRVMYKPKKKKENNGFFLKKKKDKKKKTSILKKSVPGLYYLKKQDIQTQSQKGSKDRRRESIRKNPFFSPSSQKQDYKRRERKRPSSSYFKSIEKSRGYSPKKSRNNRKRKSRKERPNSSAKNSFFNTGSMLTSINDISGSGRKIKPFRIRGKSEEVGSKRRRDLSSMTFDQEVRYLRYKSYIKKSKNYLLERKLELQNSPMLSINSQLYSALSSKGQFDAALSKNSPFNLSREKFKTTKRF